MDFYSCWNSDSITAVNSSTKGQYFFRKKKRYHEVSIALENIDQVRWGSISMIKSSLGDLAKNCITLARN